MLWLGINSGSPLLWWGWKCKRHFCGLFSTSVWGDNNLEQGVWSPAHVRIPWLWWGLLLGLGCLACVKAATIRNGHPGVCLEIFCVFEYLCRGNISKYFIWVHSLTSVGTGWEETLLTASAVRAGKAWLLSLNFLPSQQQEMGLCGRSPLWVVPHVFHLPLSLEAAVTIYFKYMPSTKENSFVSAVTSPRRSACFLPVPYVCVSHVGGLMSPHFSKLRAVRRSGSTSGGKRAQEE